MEKFLRVHYRRLGREKMLSMGKYLGVLPGRRR
jgi:hypothetical protein